MIKSILIKNFKSIKESKANFPFFGSIVGHNAAGKTNLVQALNFVRNLVLGSNTKVALENIVLTPSELFHYNESSAELSLFVEVMDNKEQEYILEVLINLVDGSVVTPTLKIGREKLQKISDEGKRITIYEREDNSLKATDGQPIPLAVEENKLALALYQNPDVLIVKDIFSKLSIPEPSSLDIRESIVNASEDGLASLILQMKHSNPDAYQQFLSITKKILPSFSAIEETPAPTPSPPTDTKQYSMVLLEEKNLKGKLSMKSVSSGDLRTLFLIAKTMNMDGGTLIIEEIENGMHPKRIKDLLDRLLTISSKKNIQIVFTTHSTVVINKMRAEDVLYVKKDEKKGTQFVRLSEIKELDRVQNLLNEGLELTDLLESRI